MFDALPDIRRLAVFPRRRRNLITTLILYLVGFLVIFIPVVGGLDVWNAYVREAGDQRRTLSAVAAAFKQPLAVAIWNEDASSIDAQVQSIARFPDVGRVQLRADIGDSAGGRVFLAGGLPAGGSTLKLSLTAPEVAGPHEPLGELELETDANALHQKLAKRIVDIFAITAAEIIGIGLLIMAGLRHLVVRPIRALARHIEHLGVTLAAAPLPPPADQDSDEFAILTHGINRMQARLSQDFAQLVQLKDELVQSEQKFVRTFDQAPTGASIVSLDGRYLRVNRELERITGYVESELQSLTMADLTHPDDRANCQNNARQLITSERDHIEEVRRYVRKDGTTVWVQVSERLMRSDAGDALYFLPMITDITDRKLAQDRIEYLAYHDDLTGLPNRVLAEELVKVAGGYSDRSGLKFAVLLLDLDNFKEINDTLGHQVGDKLLREAAYRLNNCIRQTDAACRLGGDEFVVLVSDVNRRDSVIVVAEKVLKSLGDSFFVEGHAITTSASIGISVYPDDGRTFESLLANADVAMYQVKKNGRNDFIFFDAKMNADCQERLALRNDLQCALAKNEFVLHYQPKIDLISGNVVGAEALIRWRHPTRGLVSPGQFIQIAEENGLIVPIGEWVLHEACRHLERPPIRLNRRNFADSQAVGNLRLN